MSAHVVFEATAPTQAPHDHLNGKTGGPASEGTGDLHDSPSHVQLIAEVLAAWEAEGPLVHEPTGIDALDKAVGGGPVYGTRWYVNGAPDAGKTALVVQVAHEYAARGICVGVFAVDEDAGDIVTRLAQRIGYQRRDCEERRPEILMRLREQLEGLPIRIYGAEHTIESAAADLHEMAKERVTPGEEPKCALFVDSIQTVACVDARTASATRDPSPRELVAANVQALRRVAGRYKLIAIATSEMNRGAYRSAKAAEESNDMAAGAESRAIEFSGRVLLSMRSVKDEVDCLEVAIVKNKHGRSGEKIFLAIDRSRMKLSERAAPEQPDPNTAKTSGSLERVCRDAAAVAQTIADGRQGITVRALHAAVHVKHGLSKQRTDAGIERLGAAVLRVDGKQRAVHLHLAGEKLDDDVLQKVPIEQRPSVARARFPQGDATP